MEAIINFFTVGPGESTLFVLVFGVIAIALGWIQEVACVYRRIRYLCSPATRDMVTWQTWVWMPIRLFVIVILPQVIFQFFTEVVKFG